MERSEEVVSGLPAEAEGTGGEEEKRLRSRYFRNGVIMGVLSALLILTGVYAGGMTYRLLKLRETASNTAAGSEESSVVSTDTIQKMKTLEDAIGKYFFYEDEVSSQELQDGIYKGMINALGDPYSEYYSREELEEAVNSNQGISYGIGAYISMSKQMNLAMINGVMEESPALEAGPELKETTAGQPAVIFHEAYAYLAKELGMQTVYCLNLDEERQVSARETADVLEEITEHQISIVFAEELYGKDLGNTVQEETDAEVCYLDTLVRGDYKADSYLNMAQKNIDLLKQAFKKK